MELVPLSVANELQRMRSEIAEMRTLLAPIMKDAGWLTVKDAATKYGVDVSTINRWVQSGRMCAKGAGASRRVRESEDLD
jgi:excisionase family DNA binding protein